MYVLTGCTVKSTVWWDINRFSLQKGYTDWSIKYIRKLDHYDVCFTSLNTIYLQRTLLEL